MSSIYLILWLSLLGSQEHAGPPVDLDNVPTQIKSCLDTRPGRYRVDRRLNPFYLRGDFNGDSKPDYAVWIEEVSTGKKGIAICLGEVSQSLHVLGAGTPFELEGGRRFDDFKEDFDLWGVRDRGKLSKKGDGLYLAHAESGSGLVYWDGKRFVWLQLGI
jgi:hypothetical protein